MLCMKSGNLHNGSDTEVAEHRKKITSQKPVIEGENLDV